VWLAIGNRAAPGAAICCRPHVYGARHWCVFLVCKQGNQLCLGVSLSTGIHDVGDVWHITPQISRFSAAQNACIPTQWHTWLTVLFSMLHNIGGMGVTVARLQLPSRTECFAALTQRLSSLSPRMAPAPHTWCAPSPPHSTGVRYDCKPSVAFLSCACRFVAPTMCSSFVYHDRPTEFSRLRCM
jgi:hypothetical protein